MQAGHSYVWIAPALASAAVSAVVTAMSIHYAHRRQMLDLPGRRRSHAVPTPRGGGIGIVVAVVFGLVWLGGIGAAAFDILALMAVIGSISLVALVGWIDDHRGLGAGSRLLVHCAAAAVLGLPMFGSLFLDPSARAAVPWIAAAWLVCGVAVVWSINLHNFMDGIDGLLASQAIFVFCVLAWVCLRAGRLEEAFSIGLFAVATLGFLPFNFPHARIFMGDVGSGVLGLLVAIAVFVQIAAVPVAFQAGLIACSAFIVDSGATLLSRMLGGRRWYSAHREHLYQWLVRCGYSHVRVVGLYMAWNLGVALPMIVWTLREPTKMQPGATVVDRLLHGDGALLIIYLAALIVWVVGKNYCLAAIRSTRTRTP